MFAFGILTDFRTALFPGRARLVELADRMHVLQVEALCWCGKRATHNARTENGEMVIEGEVIVVGDVEQRRRAAGRGRLRGALPPAPPPPAHRRPGPGGLDDRRAAAVRLTGDLSKVSRVPAPDEGPLMRLTRPTRLRRPAAGLLGTALVAGHPHRRDRARPADHGAVRRHAAGRAARADERRQGVPLGQRAVGRRLHRPGEGDVAREPAAARSATSTAC